MDIEYYALCKIFWSKQDAEDYINDEQADGLIHAWEIRKMEVF